MLKVDLRPGDECLTNGHDPKRPLSGRWPVDHYGRQLARCRICRCEIIKIPWQHIPAWGSRKLHGRRYNGWFYMGILP